MKIVSTPTGPSFGRNGTIEGLTTAQISKVLGFRPNTGPSRDGKVTKEWRFTVEGSPCSVWDYKGSSEIKTWSTEGSDVLLSMVFGKSYLSGI